jgi:hypothetical protein
MIKQYPKSAVGFQHPSREPGKECRDCTHFEVLHKLGCERVIGTIRAGDYCERFFNRKTRMGKKENKK